MSVLDPQDLCIPDKNKDINFSSVIEKLEIRNFINVSIYTISQLSFIKISLHLKIKLNLFFTKIFLIKDPINDFISMNDSFNITFK